MKISTPRSFFAHSRTTLASTTRSLTASHKPSTYCQLIPKIIDSSPHLCCLYLSNSLFFDSCDALNHFFSLKFSFFLHFCSLLTFESLNLSLIWLKIQDSFLTANVEELYEIYFQIKTSKDRYLELKSITMT